MLPLRLLLLRCPLPVLINVHAVRKEQEHV
jgi:hypothetical protein